MSSRQAPLSRIRFTTRHFLALTALVAVLVAFGMYARRAMDAQWGYGRYSSSEEWPRALRELIQSDKGLRTEVDPWGLGSFIDDHSVWRIKPGSDLRERLFEHNQLEPTSIRHPRSPQLIESIPQAWGTPQWNRMEWHATPGFGSTHIEGVDLYLVAEDPVTGYVYVLHEWLF